MYFFEASFKENMTIPNLLSCIRLVLIAPMVLFILEENYLMAALMLLISAISDIFDGIIARNLDQVTELGKMLDPIADKLTLIAILISLSAVNRAVLKFAAAMFAKEVMMLTGGYILLKKGLKPPAAKWFGKISTVIFYICITVLVILRAMWGIKNDTLTMVLLAVTTAAMLFSLLMYTKIFTRMIRTDKLDKKSDSK